MSAAEARDVLEKLRSYESMTWGEIEGRASHVIGVESLNKKAIKRLEELKLDDVDSVFSFRVTGKKRVIGLRLAGPQLHLLWWDPRHQVCLSHKKHT